MALKALLLKKRIEERKKALADFLTRTTLETRAAELATRERELAASIEEVNENTTLDERNALDEMVAAFEADQDAYKKDLKDKDDLEREISALEGELEAEEAAQDTTPPAPAPAAPETNERKDNKTMITRSKIFNRMTAQEREAMFAREDVKSYLGEFRSAIKEKRALNNVGLTIPTVLLGVLRENVMEFSKLYKHVFVRTVNGNGRELIMGTYEEAVWTDCCANLNEASLTFNDAEVGCWKVGAYFAVCNANLEDSDIDLAAEILTALGQGIGLALDKAILYGTGTRMPLGIVTRLVQTAQPADYPATARPWVDLHDSNVRSIPAGTEDADLFKNLVLESGVIKGKYSRGTKVWVMNETTRTYLMANALTINANGAIVAGVDGSLPVVGGIIEVLDFVPDYVIVGGYFDLYLLAERAGARFASSEHVRFLADQTVIKGTARYDGQPVIPEGFVVIGLNGTTPTAAMTFAADTANQGA